MIAFLTKKDMTTEIKKQTNIVSDWLDDQKKVMLKFSVTLVIALLVFIIGRKVIKILLKLLAHSFERCNMEASVAKFLSSCCKAGLNIILIVLIAGILGMETSSLVALVGSAGLTIGLALQGSLANFAGGVLILVLKPFRIGDFIITGGNSGTVTNIDIFYTKLLTIDNKLVVIPNGTLSNASIVNVTSEPIRRLDLVVAIDYTENVQKVKDILEQVGSANDFVLSDTATDIFISSFDASAIKMGMNLWVSKENYWPLKCQLLESIKLEFEKNNISIHFDQLDIKST